ncbi:MAG: amidohydrolase family protein [Planctomycetota bacterium]|nr:amidohydrolase family protein [Planctomycetota bacterium]
MARYLLSLLLLAGAAGAEDRILAIRGARVHTVTRGTIDPGTVIVTNGKITAVGPADGVTVPDGANVRDGRGLVLIPGLVDTHSHIGVYAVPRTIGNADGNEATGPVQSLVRAIDSFYPADPGVRMAQAGGITTANVMPGSANVMGGQTAYLKLRGKTVEEMLIDLKGGPGGMKMANGENPKRSYGSRQKSPATRMKVTALQREIFIEAQNYMKKWDAYRAKAAKGEDAPEPNRDLALEPVVEILQKKRTVHFHTHRADDVLSAMRLAEEFGFEVVLHHVTEGFLVADEIAKRKVLCSLIILDSPGGKHEAIHLRIDNPAICERAGVKVALHSDDPVTESRFFLRSGALAVRGGMSEVSALKALTIHGAEMLHLEDRIGSIEVGKDGDLVLLSGEPFSVYTRVLATWVEGDLVFDRRREKDARYATGGFGVADRLPAKSFPPIEVGKKVAAPAGARGKADGGTFAIFAGRLHPVAGDAIEDAAVLVRDGKIAAVGKRGEVAIPDGTPIVTAAVVTPGFIDAHSSVGLSGLFNVRADQDHEELVSPNQAALRVLDGFNPREELLGHLLRHGVTLIQCVPGPSNPIAGQAGLFRTHGKTVNDMLVRFPSAILFNLGEQPKRVYGSRREAPGTRMGTAAIIRRALAEAPQRDEKDTDGEEKRNLDKEVLRLLLSGDIPAIFTAHREDDLLTAVRIAKEFGLRYSLSQATEGYLVADEISRAGAPVLMGPTMQRLGDLQRSNTCLEAAALLSQKDIRIAITSGFESYVPKTRVVLFEAAVAAANGLGYHPALKAITLDAARILAIDDRFGSIEPGKVADLVLFDGDPFEYTSHITHVYVAGRLAHSRP